VALRRRFSLDVPLDVLIFCGTDHNGKTRSAYKALAGRSGSWMQGKNSTSGDVYALFASYIQLHAPHDEA